MVSNVRFPDGEASRSVVPQRAHAPEVVVHGATNHPSNKETRPRRPPSAPMAVMPMPRVKRTSPGAGWFAERILRCARAFNATAALVTAKS